MIVYLAALRFGLLNFSAIQAEGPRLRVPARRRDAVGGSEFAREIRALPQREREEQIWRQVVTGNVPDFLRHLVPVPVFAGVNDQVHSGRFFVTPDYLAVGSNEDYLLVPLTPYTAQRIASRLRCILPTPKMVDAIYSAAKVKLTPTPIPPSPEMTTVPVFEAHNLAVASQRATTLGDFPLGTLTSGDKKDIVICKALSHLNDRVAIYGWHLPGGKPIQPLYVGHFAYWADYSHGVRLVDRDMELDGKRIGVERVLADANLSSLLSSEGSLSVRKYRFRAFLVPAAKPAPVH